ncbi:MAG: Rpn family recombination-promoting nuclease/putative transposase [Clostridiales bacterium]|nr:Rpn family recombination-promoting nuclease/putative transposase [Clostridiales bacterium]
MEVETTLSKNISNADDKAMYDAACKRLLSNKIILAWILKECVEEYQMYDVDEIAGKYIEGEPQVAEVAVHPDEKAEHGPERIRGLQVEDSSINEGTVTFDIRFYALLPSEDEWIRIILNLEMQNDFYPGYPIIKRGIYYCGRMLSSQYETEFTNSHYEKIKKVVSIWICSNPPEKYENTINVYSLKEKNLIGTRQEKTENYDLLTVVMIYLGDENKEESTGILRFLKVLLSSELDAEEKKQILQDDYSIAMTKKIESEVSEMCNLSKGVEERGISKGITIGRTEGITIGRTEGRTQAMVECIRILMDREECTAEVAMDILKISDEEKDACLEKMGLLVSQY